MPLPKWAKEKSSEKAIETKADRLREEQLKKTIAKENADPELSLPNVNLSPDRSGVMQQRIEMQFEGNALDYHGH